MSARTRCPLCGWHRTYRKQKAGRRAVRSHACHPGHERRAA